MQMQSLPTVMIKIFNIPRGKILVFIQPSPWNKQTNNKKRPKARVSKPSISKIPHSELVMIWDNFAGKVFI